MERHYYNAESLGSVVAWFEDRYGIGSDELLRLHRAGESMPGLAPSDRHLWLSFYREVRRLRGIA